MKKMLLLVILMLVVSSAYADKKLTIKGIYQPGAEFNSDTSIKEGDEKLTNKGNYDVDGGLGFGAEYSFYSQNTIEILGGFNYMFSREIPKANGTFKYSDAWGSLSLKYKGDIDDAKLDVMSFYVKPRYLFEQPKANNVAGYIAGKLSYNIVSMKWDDADVKTKNGFGFGISAGAIFNDQFDCEIAWDKISGDMKEYGELDGTYDMSTLSFSLGLRF